MYSSKKSLSNQITGTTISQVTSLFVTWIVAYPKLKYTNYRPLLLILIASFSFNRASVDIVETAESIIGKVDICTEPLVWRQCGSGARISVLLPALRSLVHSAPRRTVICLRVSWRDVCAARDLGPARCPLFIYALQQASRTQNECFYTLQPVLR